MTTFLKELLEAGQKATPLKPPLLTKEELLLADDEDNNGEDK